MSPLQKELRKKQPFQSPAQEALLNLLRTADQIQHAFAGFFRGYRLTSSQYNVLRILRGEGQPLPILEIAHRTITVVPGITGLVDRLEQAGLVERTRCDRDRRVIHVAITARALKLLGKIDQPLADLHARLAGALSTAELGRLSALTEKLRNPG